MTIITLTQHNFDEVLVQHDLLVIDFWARWCQPCQSFLKVMQQAVSKHPDVTFASIDVDVEKTLTFEFCVRSVPRIIILREQTAVYDDSGTLSAKVLDELLDQARSLDFPHSKDD